MSQKTEFIEFYDSINSVIEKIPKHELLIVMGDFNAKLGVGNSSHHVGQHGLGERNERGDLLEIFAESNDQDKPEKIVRNQIDYRLLKPILGPT